VKIFEIKPFPEHVVHPLAQYEDLRVAKDSELLWNEAGDDAYHARAGPMASFEKLQVLIDDEIKDDITKYQAPLYRPVREAFLGSPYDRTRVRAFGSEPARDDSFVERSTCQFRMLLALAAKQFQYFEGRPFGVALLAPRHEHTELALPLEEVAYKLADGAHAAPFL
jgi:hypothetical protein